MSDPAPYSDPRAVASLLSQIEATVRKLGRPLNIMEVCGTHTHAIAAAGLRPKLKPGIRLISGPGCPVCVTPVDYLDRAEALCALDRTVLCTFGDLFRVPSSRGSLERLSAGEGDVRIVYSPRDALQIARDNPGDRVVFLAVGFETTAPAIAATLVEADRDGVDNFMILPGNKIVPPPLRVLASAPDVRVDGFLLPGHVSVITGSRLFGFLADEYGLPSAVVGFTPTDILKGVLEVARQSLEGRPSVANLYSRVVTEEGNLQAKALLDRFFQPEDTVWRGLGPIPGSGLALRPEWAGMDASRLEVDLPDASEPPGCRCGEVLKGAIEPPECPLFGTSCDPDAPVGACMVSSEGTCAAWYRHERYRAGAAS